MQLIKNDKKKMSFNMVKTQFIIFEYKKMKFMFRQVLNCDTAEEILSKIPEISNIRIEKDILPFELSDEDYNKSFTHRIAISVGHFALVYSGMNGFNPITREEREQVREDILALFKPFEDDVALLKTNLRDSD